METRQGKQLGPPGPSPQVTAPSLLQSRWVLGLLFLLVSATYFYAAIVKSRTANLWMDEILAVSVARQLSLAAIWSAIWHGLELTPPTYDILLHYLARLAGEGSGRLIWRLPSIAAVYATAVCVYFLLRKQLSPLVALLAFGIVLDSELFDFAVQARQYALSTLGLTIALLLWNNFPGTRFPKLQSAALWLVLSLCISLYFFGIIEVAVIGAAEAIWFLTRKQFRLGIWLSVVLTIPIAAAWRPLASHLASLYAINATAPGYFGRPTASSFIDAMFDVVLGGKPGALLLLAGLVLIGFAYLLQNSDLRPFAHENLPPQNPRRFALSRLEIILLSIFSLPFLTFALAFFVTKTFSPRYIIAAALLSAIAPAVMLNRLPSRRLVALALIPLLLGTMAGRAHAPLSIIPESATDALALLRTPRPPLPIVVGEGLLYIELMDSADPKTRSLLVYLERPADQPSPDPTNENLVKNLAAFRPDYRVQQQSRFLANHPSFYLLARPNASTDTTTPSLIQQKLIVGMVNQLGDAQIFRANANAGR